MVKGCDFDKSHSPVVHHATLLLFIAIAAHRNLLAMIGDIVNAFQNCVADKKRFIVTLLLFYLEWYKDRFLHNNLEGDNLVMEVMRLFQGEKDVGRM